MRTYLLPVLIFMMVLGGCKQPSGTSTDETLDEILSKSDGEVVLEFGEKRDIGAGELTLEFVDVVEDSRCPQNVTCVWAGNGEVEILVNNVEAHINTNLEPQEVVISGVTIELIELSPYPVYEQPFEKEDYKVRLLIREE